MRLAVALFAVGFASFRGVAANAQACQQQYALDVAAAFQWDASRAVSNALARYGEAPTPTRFEAIGVEVANEMRKRPLYVDAKEVQRARDRYHVCLGGGYGAELVPLASRSVTAPSCTTFEPPVEKRRDPYLPLPRVWNSGTRKAPTLEDFELETLSFEQEWLDFQERLDDLGI